jgi:hypothetical protein
MHRAALQGLELVGNKLKQETKNNVATREPANPSHLTKTDHRAITTVLGTEAEVNDPNLHHQGTTISHGTEEADDPNPRGTLMTTKTTKLRWGRHALLVEFAERQYPKDSSYPMINKSTTDLMLLP